jgi:glycosyltransferase involved in cell wall biosynthesis
VPTRPLVSVLTPTYNGANVVAATIESVLAQTYEPVEHVLVDDASSDDTLAILRDYESQHPDRIRVLAHRDRAGPCRRRNDALEAARGSYLAWLDHDDVWLPEKIERQVEALDADPRVGFVYTQSEAFDDVSGETVDRTRVDLEGDVLERLFVEGCVLASSTVVIRRDALEGRGLGFRDSEFSFGDDYFLWLALALDWRLARVDEVLVRLRRHDRNESARSARERGLAPSVALLEEFLETFPEATERLGALRRIGLARSWGWAADYERRRRQRMRAARYAGRAAALDPRGAARFLLRATRRRVARIS